MVINPSQRMAEEIKLKLAEAEHQRREYQRRIHERMEHERPAANGFATLAGKIIDEIVEPRMRQMADLFVNASLANDTAADHPYHCVCTFEPTERYPVTVCLEIGVGHDEQVENGIVFFDLNIKPAFVDFDRHDDIRFPLGEMNEAWIIAWVEEKILQFVDTYLKIEHVDQYQHRNLVTDPVCRMRINKTMAAGSAQYDGQTYYFCVQGCRDRFVQSPERFVQAARQTGHHEPVHAACCLVGTSEAKEFPMPHGPENPPGRK